MPTNSSLAYQGTVTTKVMHFNKVISSKTYHNTGNLPLFKFICYCLAGDFGTIANNLIPMKIRLYYNSSTSPTNATDAEDTIHAMSSLISVNTTASVFTSAADNYCSTTLHFLVPYALIRIDEEHKSVNEIALFPAEATEADAKITESNSRYSAKYLLTKTDATGRTLLWDPIDLSDFKENYNVVVEWEMKISNNT